MRRCLFAALIVGLVCALTLTASAGTTGSLRGRVLDALAKTPLADAKVDVASGSQSASTVTDASGYFAFVSLPPDSYTVTARKGGYDSQSQPAVSIFADQATNLALELTPTLKVIGSVTSRSSTNLVRQGTTSDVYSVNPAGQKAAAALAGPGGVNQAYSAIASVPGVSLPSGQQGWYQSVYIRGGDYDQVAYEFDGVPVIRESDGAPIVTLSALGQQEVQVYTGGTPATSDSPGLAGYINQVIKTGSQPGFMDFNASVGAPAFYHKLSAEFSGASSNRLFSYYVGTAAVNQDNRYGSQFNGTGDPLYFYPLTIPSGNVFQVLDGSGGPAPNYGAVFSAGNTNAQATNADRETVANFHFGIPHKHNQGRDDIQLLYVTGNIATKFYSSANEVGIPPVTYVDSTPYTGALLAPPDPTKLTVGLFPSSPQNRASGDFVNPKERDGSLNGFSITKLQFQRNINSHSYLRAIGYGEYTNWFITGPTSAQLTFGAALPDYEVLGHIYGASLIFSNSLSNKHLITASASYQTQKLQTYNAGFGNAGLGDVTTNLTDAIGNCYNPVTGFRGSCFDSTIQGNPTNLSPPITAPAGTPVFSNNARWIVTENGRNAQVDNVTPYFSSVALTDIYRPSDKLTINAGLRLDRFAYRLDDLASAYPARQFWFNAYNSEFCGAPGLPLQQRTFDAAGNLSACNSGYTPSALRNATASRTSAAVLQPRLAFTYAISPDTVLRGSYGHYARPAATSYQQFNTVQQNLPSFIAQFYPLGFTTPNHDVRPDTSDNFDFSLERHVRGTNLSFKLSPFYRSTKNQLQYLNIDALGGILAGVNAGRLRSFGLELSMQGGDFAKDGLSYQLAYTYTNSKIRYLPLANGLNIIDILNRQIQRYNSYTQDCAGASASGSLLCGTTNAGNSQENVASTDANGNPIIVANPYFHQRAQPLLDAGAQYTPYDTLPGAFSGANSYAVPHVASLILNYRHRGVSVTPSFTYTGGSFYGSPLVWPGYIPQSCTAQPSATPQTPGISCSGMGLGGVLFLPDPYTGGRFDAIGGLRQPSQLTANLQLSYDINKHSSLTLIATGLYNKCFQRG
ncbi:MAG: TonB-dependent receptor, partial [Candidatus Eremiobacteraeota bacterium]|nr:TonB-dependent receptor [Candidatus Eremiobacteraeota bacterium]